MDDALLAAADHHIVPILKRIKKLDLNLRFHCPNGLHCRFLTPDVARLMAANRFEMIRLSYESSDQSLYWREASDYKVSDRIFHEAVENLLAAGFRPDQLDAYILTGLPGQTLDECERSARAVHDLGLKIRLCQYSPIPNTPLFERACREYGVDSEEPLLHNNTILPTLDRRVGFETFQRFKNRVDQMNHSLA